MSKRVPSMIGLRLHHPGVGGIWIRVAPWRCIIPILWQGGTLIRFQGPGREWFVVGEVVRMFLEQIPAIRFLDRVLEACVGALVVDQSEGGMRRLLPVQVGLGSPEAALWSCVKLVWVAPRSMRWINYLLSVERGIGPWGGEYGTSWAE